MHTSVPANPLLAEPMFLKGYIERLGTGTADIVRIAREYNLREPEFEQEDTFKVSIFRPITGEATGELTGELTGEVVGQLNSEVIRIVQVLEKEMKRSDLQKAVGINHDDYFRTHFIIPAMDQGYIEMKFPDKVNHPGQRYRLTKSGQQLKAFLKKSK